MLHLNECGVGGGKAQSALLRANKTAVRLTRKQHLLTIIAIYR